jgi:hypothetical protein
MRKNEMRAVQTVAREMMFSWMPSHHKFVIKTTFEHGEPAVINALKGIGYSWKTARQLYLAYKEQQQSQDEA